MKNIQKGTIWYLMFCKRLLHKGSFLALLCLIPCIMLLAGQTMSSGESGILTIALATQDADPMANAVIRSLTESRSLIRYVTFASATDATEAVKKQSADGAWIFTADTSKKAEAFGAGKSGTPLVEIVIREESIPLNLAQELLYGALFPHLSYQIYQNFVYENLVTAEDVPKNTIKDYFNSIAKNDSIIEIKRLNQDAPISKTNYLTAPLRGILSLLVVLCGLAAAMYFLQDQAEGKYDWLSPRRRLLPAFASCLSAVLFAALAVLIALFCSGFSVGLWNECIAMLLFAISCSGFCLVFCIIFRSPGKLGATIPGVMILLLALSPIFFNLKVLRPVRLMLPTYYYLQSIYNSQYNLFALFYSIGIFAVVFLLNHICKKR